MRGNFAPAGTLTWNSQCSFVLPVTNGKDTLFMYLGDRWSFPKQGSAATHVWQPITLKGDSMSIPNFIESWHVDFPKPEWSAVETKAKFIKDEFTLGDWEIEDKTIASNEKGASATYSFSGRQIGIKAVSNNTSGYARLIIKNSKNKEVINTIVDFYSKYEYSSLKFLSPLMEKDQYTLSIVVIGEHGIWTDKRKNIFGSTDNYIRIEDVFAVK